MKTLNDHRIIADRLMKLVILNPDESTKFVKDIIRHSEPEVQTLFNREYEFHFSNVISDKIGQFLLGVSLDIENYCTLRGLRSNRTKTYGKRKIIV